MTRRLHTVTAPIAEDLAAQDAALDHPCPRCDATKDTYCTNPHTGQNLHHNTSHWQRIPKDTP